MNKYTDRQVDILLNGWFRSGPRPRPYRDIAAEMGVDNPEALDDLLWKVITGYGGNTPVGPRRKYTATIYREGRAGMPWTGRDRDALRAALVGEGRLRDPACDVAYIAAVLARGVEEVETEWARMNPGRTGAGFGLVP